MTAYTSDLAQGHDPAVARRARALELSGWGTGFHLVQPRNIAFWVFIVLTAVGLFQIWSYFKSSVGLYLEPYIFAGILCLLCGVAWATWFHYIDRWERQPAALIVTALAWGAIPATFAFALPANSAMLAIYAKLFGQDWAGHWAAGLTAPFTEEVAKLCGLVLIATLAPRLVRTANDGLIIGAFVGLGFAVFEDFLYAANGVMASFSSNPEAAALSVSATRIATSAVSHPLFSALVFSGAIYLVGTQAQPRRVGRGIALVFAGMLFHFSWDDASGLGGGSGLGIVAVMVASIVLAFTVLAIAFRLAAPQERQFVRDMLAPELEAGEIASDELEALLTRRAKKKWLHAASNRRARRARKHLRRAWMELCHAYGAQDLERISRVRNEIALLRDHANP